MTLVLSCTTRDYVIQVSDRRLVCQVGNRVDVQEDNANKVTLFNQRIAFAYTGLAEIDGKRTDKWLVDVLAAAGHSSLVDACSMIESSATDAFRRMHLPSGVKRHAFVGVGWTLSAVNNQYRAITCTITNAQSKQGEWLSEAQGEFRTWNRILPESNLFQLEVTGQPIEKTTRVDLERQIKSCVGRRTSPKPIARLLVNKVREAAVRNDKIGQNLLVVSLPKSAIPHGQFVFINAPPEKEEMTFLYMPTGKDDGIQYGPNLVYGGLRFQDFVAHYEL